MPKNNKNDSGSLFLQYYFISVHFNDARPNNLFSFLCVHLQWPWKGSGCRAVIGSRNDALPVLDGGSFSHSLGKHTLGSPALLNAGMAWGDISLSVFIHCLYAVDRLRVTHYLSLPDISTPVHNQICILNRSYFNTRCKWDLRCFTHMADLINNHAYSESRAAYRRQSKQMSFVFFADRQWEQHCILESLGTAVCVCKLWADCEAEWVFHITPCWCGATSSRPDLRVEGVLFRGNSQPSAPTAY